MKQYIYQGVTYKSEREVRKAVFDNERKAFGSPETADEWSQLGVVYTEVESQLTQEQKALRVRDMRDRLLAACDYYVMPDYPSTEEGLAEVKAYRQALRDITKQEGFPFEIVWPVVPSVLG